MDNVTPSIPVTFVDRQTKAEWTEPVVCLPQKGDTVFLYRAPEGTTHVVVGVRHEIGSACHSIRIELDPLLPQ
jgi:hypothetical protein